MNSSLLISILIEFLTRTKQYLNNPNLKRKDKKRLRAYYKQEAMKCMSLIVKSDPNVLIGDPRLVMNEDEVSLLLPQLNIKIFFNNEMILGVHPWKFVYYDETDSVAKLMYLYQQVFGVKYVFNPNVIPKNQKKPNVSKEEEKTDNRFSQKE